MSELLINPYAFASAPTFDGPEDVVGAVACWVADDIAQVNSTAVTSWTDRKNSIAITQADTNKQPLYLTGGIASQPAVDFDGNNDFLAVTTADAVSTASSGHVFAVIRHDAINASQAIWASGDHASNVRYLEGRTISSNRAGVIQVNNDTHDQLEGNTAIAASTNYLIEVASTGTAYEVRVNNTVQSLSVLGGANTGDWFGDTSARDAFTVGCIKMNAGEFDRFNGKIAMVLVVDGAISGGDRTSLGSWITSKYSITLA